MASRTILSGVRIVAAALSCSILGRIFGRGLAVLSRLVAARYHKGTPVRPYPKCTSACYQMISAMVSVFPCVSASRRPASGARMRFIKSPPSAFNFSSLSNAIKFDIHSGN